MTEKATYLDRILSRRSSSIFDGRLLSNDGGKYSPTIRRLRQYCLHDTKLFTNKFLSPAMQVPLIAKRLSKPPTGDSQIASSQYHRQSSIDLAATSLKCDDCAKYEGLFQCCHCNQRFCIRCCHRHQKKVTNDFEHLNELSNALLAKIIHEKNDLEKQKNEAIERCHKWRVDTINSVNEAHKLTVQTIYDEYEILNEEYELFIEKEISHMNIDGNDLKRTKKKSIASLLLSPSSTMSSVNSTKSIDIVKKHVEMLSKYLDEIQNVSFHVKLPPFDINDNVQIESQFGLNKRCISVTRQNQNYFRNASLIKSNTIVEQGPSDSESANSSSPISSTEDGSISSFIEQNMIYSSDHHGNTFRSSSCSKSLLDQSLHNNQHEIPSQISTTTHLTRSQNNHQYEEAFHQISTSSLACIDNADFE